MPLWFFKLFGWALALGELFSGLKAVKAKAPETSVDDYTEAAATVLAQPEVAAWLERVEAKYGAGKAEAVRGELPFALWLIDYATER
jgi:hypothetical protein